MLLDPKLCILVSIWFYCLHYSFKKIHIQIHAIFLQCENSTITEGTQLQLLWSLLATFGQESIRKFSVQKENYQEGITHEKLGVIVKYILEM